MAGIKAGDTIVAIDGQPTTDWLTTTDHKRIGILYIATSLAFFGAGAYTAGILIATSGWSWPLAALAGLLLAPVFTVYPQMGVEMILLAFIVVILVAALTLDRAKPAVPCTSIPRKPFPPARSASACDRCSRDGRRTRRVSP